jgi:O-antigen ligase
LPSKRRFSLSGIDAIGLALVAAFSGWILYDAWLTYGWAVPMLLTLLLCVGAYVAGRLGTRYGRRWLVPTLVVALATVLLYFYMNPTTFFNAGATIGVLRYSNARAALFVQAAFAGIMIAANRRWRRGYHFSRRVAFSAALAGSAIFAMLAVAIRSTGGRVTAALLIPALVIATRRKARRTMVVCAIAVWGGAVVSSFLLAEAFSRGTDSPVVAQAGYALGFGRVALWAEGYELFRAHLSRGVGPDFFRLASGTARARPGILQWAHNEYLQQAAETGIVGLALMLALFGWTFARLARTRTVLSALAALAVSALAVHACVDYLFHFPLLPAITAALAGSATGGQRGVRRRVRRRRRRVTPGHRPAEANHLPDGSSRAADVPAVRHA